METETFQHYQILRRGDGSLWELGRGAMAVTYKAIDSNLRCPVALKVVSTLGLQDDHTRARFVREAQAAAALRHANIASVYHLGNDEQSYFYAMEFIDGETVEDLVIRHGPLPAKEALDIAAQVARALGAAAKQGLVHRDIKPANLMVVHEEDEESPLVKVIDFGLARRAVIADGGAQITMSGFVGTPHYASPEQIAECDLDSRSDIYSLGVTLWYMLTGQPTFTGSLGRIGSQHLRADPPWVLIEDAPVCVQTLLRRMLAKDPADRPQDPGKLRREIESCLEDPTVATATGAIRVPAKTPAEPGDFTAVPPNGATVAEGPAGDETAVPNPPEAMPQGPPPAAGETLAERFRLLEPVGTGTAGQVFRATDARHGARPVAIKVLRPELKLGRQEIHGLRNDLRRLRAAPHSRLTAFFALEQARGYWFAASEWINGFTLVDLLRHRGQLDLPEALRLLGDACAAAAHGSANGLHRLQLAPHAILIHFPAAFVGDKARVIRAILDRPLAQWPEFGLKIDAISPARGAWRTPTWVGSMTLVPSAPEPGQDSRSCIRGVAQDSLFHTLGSLFYEMLNGTLPPITRDSGRDVPPLPALGEEANKLLRSALSPSPSFRDEHAFFDALLAASGLEREDLPMGPTRVPPVPVIDPVGDATVVPLRERTTSSPVTGGTPARMAPTIRTKLLRPRADVLSATAAGLPGQPQPKRVTLAWAAFGIAGLAAAVIASGYLLWSQHSRSTLPNSRAVGPPLPDAATPTTSPAP